MYKHQKLRKQAPEIEALKLGTCCEIEDFKKAFVIIDSTAGDSHPGSVHLQEISRRIKKEIDNSNSLKGFNYYATDMCDGIAQGHEGMYYSLVSRDMIANMMEVHVQSSPYDAAIYLSSCDKGIPGSLMAMCRNNIPSIFVTGGIMKEGKNQMTLEQVGKYNIDFLQNKISEQEFMQKKNDSCPSAGACSFMGTAATMQVMVEALGVGIPGMALVPTHVKDFHEQFSNIDQLITKLLNLDLKPSNIITEKAIKNALVIHSAIGGSTNVFLHIPAICKELNIEFKSQWINEANEKVKTFSKIRPIGELAGEYFWYAGGLPKLMLMLEKYLNLDILTITGKTHRQNISDLEKKGFFERTNAFLRLKNKTQNDVFATNPTQHFGNILLLKGNIAKEGCLIKTANFTEEMAVQRLRCVVFDSENQAFEAVINGEIEENSAIIVRYAGPNANGMPEMFYLTEAIANVSNLATTCALITDGRFSGASHGPIVGHVSPEASRGGLIKYVINGDYLEINLNTKAINIIDNNNVVLADEILMKRNVSQKQIKKTGVLKLYTKQAVSAIKGAYMEDNYED